MFRRSSCFSKSICGSSVYYTRIVIAMWYTLKFRPECCSLLFRAAFDRPENSGWAVFPIRFGQKYQKFKPSLLSIRRGPSYINVWLGLKGEKPFRYSRIALTAYGATTCSMPGGGCFVYVADRAKGASIRSKRHIYWTVDTHWQTDLVAAWQESAIQAKWSVSLAHWEVS